MAIVPDESPTSAPEADFGANDWLLEEMYEQYTADPSSVDETWAEYFKSHGAPTTDAGNGGAAERQEPEPRRDAEPPARWRADPNGSSSCAGSRAGLPAAQPKPSRPRHVARRQSRSPRQPRRSGRARRERAAGFLLIPRAIKIGQTSHSKSQSKPPCAGLWHVLPRTWTSP